MKRYDLRHLKDDFYDRMVELIDKGITVGEVGIFLFEVGDFSSIQKSADTVRATGHDLMNSLKFNEVDWTVVVKKVDEATKTARAEKIAAAKLEAEKKAEEARMLQKRKRQIELQRKQKPKQMQRKKLQRLKRKKRLKKLKQKQRLKKKLRQKPKQMRKQRLRQRK